MTDHIRKRVAVLFGGRSVEHEISIRSAKNVVAYIDTDSYSIVLLGIDKNGSWHLNNTIDDEIKSGTSVSISLDVSVSTLRAGVARPVKVTVC